jgi:hypothetical protein
MLGRSVGTILGSLVAATVVSCAGPATPDDGGGDANRDARMDARADTGAVPVDSGEGGTDVLVSVDVVAFDGPSPMGDANDATSIDATGSACAELDDRYAALVRLGQSCASASDCNETVCETLCCTCEIYVNGSAVSMGQLAALRQSWALQHCTDTITCATTLCDPATGGVCSSTGQCATLRRPGGNG